MIGRPILTKLSIRIRRSSPDFGSLSLAPSQIARTEGAGGNVGGVGVVSFAPWHAQVAACAEATTVLDCGLGREDDARSRLRGKQSLDPDGTAQTTRGPREPHRSREGNRSQGRGGQDEVRRRRPGPQCRLDQAFTR